MRTIYFTDRDLGRRFPAILRSAGITVEEHQAHFDPATPDAEWLATIAARNWFVLTHDRRIRYKANERDAVMRAGIGMFVVIGSAPHPQLAESFVRTIASVESMVRSQARPFIAKVYRPSPSDTARNPMAPGRVELWLSHEMWLRGLR